MSPTLESLQAELEPYKGTLVLDCFKVVRLVGVEYSDDDFFWVYDTHKGITGCSVLLGWMPLKGVLPEKGYNKLVKIWNLNNEVKAI